MIFSVQRGDLSQLGHHKSEFDQQLNLLDDFPADLQLFNLACQSRGGAVGSSPHDESLMQQHVPEPRRVLLHRKAQQRVRQRQKPRKASETSELLCLRGEYRSWNKW